MLASPGPGVKLLEISTWILVSVLRSVFFSSLLEDAGRLTTQSIATQARRSAPSWSTLNWAHLWCQTGVPSIELQRNKTPRPPEDIDVTGSRTQPHCSVNLFGLLFNFVSFSVVSSRIFAWFCLILAMLFAMLFTDRHSNDCRRTARMHSGGGAGDRGTPRDTEISAPGVLKVCHMSRIVKVYSTCEYLWIVGLLKFIASLVSWPWLSGSMLDSECVRERTGLCLLETEVGSSNLLASFAHVRFDAWTLVLLDLWMPDRVDQLLQRLCASFCYTWLALYVSGFIMIYLDITGRPRWFPLDRLQQGMSISWARWRHQKSWCFIPHVQGD